MLAPAKSGKPGSEETPAGLRDMRGHYKRSKFLAEQEVRRFIAKGLPAVIVNPTAPIGAMDRKPTPTGKIIVDFLNGKMPAYLDTGLNFVDVEDVAEAHVLASKSGVVGESYISGKCQSHPEAIPAAPGPFDGKEAAPVETALHTGALPRVDR